MAQKINLQVKKNHGTLAGQFTYEFKILTYEAVTLSNYRIVMYFHSFWKAVNQTISVDATGNPWGGNSGSPAPSISYKYFNTELAPPRIYPSDKRYNVKIQARFTTGTGVDGGYWDSIILSYHHSAYKNCVTNQDSNSYSYTSSASFTDNPTFVLEYNATDPGTPTSNNWVKVSEVTSNTGTPDTNTGTYPLGDTFKDDTTQIDPVTGAKHIMLFANEDTYIRDTTILNYANTNYGGEVLLHLRKHIYVSYPDYEYNRIMLKWNVPGSTIGNTVNAAESWIYSTAKDTPTGLIYDAVKLTGAWTELGATWNNSNTLFGATESSFTNPATTVADSVDVYNTFALNPATVIGWKTNNYGLGIKYQTEATPDQHDQYASRTTAISDGTSGSPYVIPRLVVAYQGTEPVVSTRRIFMVS